MLSTATARSKSFLAGEAIKEYLDIHDRQLREIKQGIIEADAKELVTHEHVVKKWKSKHADSLDKERRQKS